MTNEIDNTIKSYIKSAIPNKKSSDLLLDALDWYIQNSSLSNKQFIGTTDKEKFKVMLAENANNGGSVVWIGDSITEQGKAGVGNGVGFTTYIQNQFPGATYSCLGIGGTTSKDVLTAIESYKALKADIYVVGIGINDIRYNDSRGATSQSAYLANMQSIIDGLKSVEGAQVAIISIFPSFWKDQFSALYRFTTDNRMLQYNKALAKLCKDNSVLFLDAYSLIRNYINCHNVNTLIPDGVHPLQSAYDAKKLYADAVLNDVVIKGAYSSEYVPTGTYYFKLVAHYHGVVAAGGYVGIKNIGTSVSESFPITANLDYLNITNLFGTYNSGFAGYYNKANDFPLYLTFSTSSWITSLPTTGIVSGTGINRGIRSYDMYVSREPEALTDLNHPSWVLFSSEKTNSAITTNILPSRRPGIIYELIVSTYGNAQTNLKLKKIGGKLPIRVWTQNVTAASAQLLPKLFTTGVDNVSEALIGVTPSFVLSWESEEELTSVILESYDSSLGNWVLKKSYNVNAINNPIDSSWVQVASGTGDQTVSL